LRLFARRSNAWSRPGGRRLRFYQVYLSSEGISRPQSCRLAKWQRAVVEKVFDNTAAEHRECTLSHRLTDG
jgi:hypothetical protein